MIEQLPRGREASESPAAHHNTKFHTKHTLEPFIVEALEGRWSDGLCSDFLSFLIFLLIELLIPRSLCPSPLAVIPHPPNGSTLKYLLPTHCQC